MMTQNVTKGVSRGPMDLYMRSLEFDPDERVTSVNEIVENVLRYCQAGELITDFPTRWATCNIR